MNKISLLILLALFVNFGCGKKEKVSSEQNPSVTQNDSSSNETNELKEPVTPVEEPLSSTRILPQPEAKSACQPPCRGAAMNANSKMRARSPFFPCNSAGRTYSFEFCVPERENYSRPDPTISRK